MLRLTCHIRWQAARPPLARDSGVVTRDDIVSEVRPMRLGIPSPYNRQVTLRANSLQMFHASRWIVSSRPDFSTPKMMIANSEEFRTRPKVRAE
jgi:hypothetical protein